MTPPDHLVREALTARGIALSAILDMSPVDLEAELAQAAADGSFAARNILNSSGFDDEFRAWEAGRGQQEAVSMILPDEVEDPFAHVMEAGFDKAMSISPFEMPTEVPDLVLHATMGV